MRVKFCLTLILAALTITSCKKKEEDLIPEVEIKDIDITSSATQKTISLSWKPVEGCFWFVISIGETGQALQEYVEYQDVINDPISYNITDLNPNTTYNIKLEGKDYLEGGKKLAEGIATQKTLP